MKGLFRAGLIMREAASTRTKLDIRNVCADSFALKQDPMHETKVF